MPCHLSFVLQRPFLQRPRVLESLNQTVVEYEAPFFEDAVLKLFLFVGGEASGKLNHQYCDSTFIFIYLFVLQAAGANFVSCRSHTAAKFGHGNVYSSANSLKSFRSSFAVFRHCLEIK